MLIYCGKGLLNRLFHHVFCDCRMYYSHKKSEKVEHWTVVKGQSHKSHNALDKYPSMHHFVIEICTRALFLLQSGVLWDM